MEKILDIVKNHVSVPEGAAYCLGMTDGYPSCMIITITVPYAEQQVT